MFLPRQPREQPVQMDKHYYCHNCKIYVDVNNNCFCQRCHHGFIEIRERPRTIAPTAEAPIMTMPLAGNAMVVTPSQSEEAANRAIVPRPGGGNPRPQMFVDSASGEIMSGPPARQVSVEQLQQYLQNNGQLEQSLRDNGQLAQLQNFFRRGAPEEVPAEQRLERLRFQHLTDKEIADMDDAQCSVCITKINSSDNKIAKLDNCHHVFHYRCITRWLEGHNTCPLCQQRAINP